MRNDDFPVGILAYVLLRCEGALRNMCFIDNEHGTSMQEQIDTISFRCVNIINAALAARHRYIRVFSINPWPKRHHHIQVQWGFVAHVTDDGVEVPMTPLPELIANLYIPSKRVQDEEEERVGPRRGEKLKRPKYADGSKKKPKRRYDQERDLDATDSGGEMESSPMMGSEADADALNENEIKTDQHHREMASA